MEHTSSFPIELLTSSDQVSDLAHILFQEQRIAIDTESNSRHRYPERVCLVQVATNSNVYLIDPLAVDDMKPLGEVLADETVVKVIQGAEYDIRCLDREWGFRVRNLFDTSVAARFVGMERTGLSILAESLLGVQIPKLASIQKGDWSSLIDYLNALHVDHIVMECAHRPITDLEALREVREDIGLGIGVIDIKRTEIESADEVAKAIEHAAHILGRDRLRYVHPDCGFWMLDRSIADAKIRSLVAGRDTYLGTSSTR